MVLSLFGQCWQSYLQAIISSHLGHIFTWDSHTTGRPWHGEETLHRILGKICTFRSTTTRLNKGRNTPPRVRWRAQALDRALAALYARTAHGRLLSPAPAPSHARGRLYKYPGCATVCPSLRLTPRARTPTPASSPPPAITARASATAASSLQPRPSCTCPSVSFACGPWSFPSSRTRQNLTGDPISSSPDFGRPRPCVD